MVIDEKHRGFIFSVLYKSRLSIENHPRGQSNENYLFLILCVQRFVMRPCIVVGPRFFSMPFIMRLRNRSQISNNLFVFSNVFVCLRRLTRITSQLNQCGNHFVDIYIIASVHLTRNHLFVVCAIDKMIKELSVVPLSASSFLSTDDQLLRCTAFIVCNSFQHSSVGTDSRALTKSVSLPFWKMLPLDRLCVCACRSTQPYFVSLWFVSIRCDCLSSRYARTHWKCSPKCFSISLRHTELFTRNKSTHRTVQVCVFSQTNESYNVHS